MSILSNPALWIIILSFIVLIAAAVTYAFVREMTWYVWLMLGISLAGFLIAFAVLIFISLRKPKVTEAVTTKTTSTQVNQGNIPVTTQTTQVNQRSMPVATQTTQVNQRSMPVVTKTTQVNQRSMPVVTKTTQVNQRSMPVTTQTNQVNQRSMPVATQTTQFNQRNMPVATQTTQVNQRNIPVVESSQAVASANPSQTKSVTREIVGDKIVTTKSTVTKTVRPYNNVYSPTDEMLTSLAPVTV